MDLNLYDEQCCYDVNNIVLQSSAILDLLLEMCNNENSNFSKLYDGDLLIINYLTGNARLTYVFDPLKEVFSVTIYSPYKMTLLMKKLMSIVDLNTYVFDRRSHFRILYLEGTLESEEYYYNNLYKEEVINILSIIDKTCLRYTYNFYKLIREIRLSSDLTEKIKDSF